LQENIGAANIKLTPKELNDITSALKKITVVGNRYPEELEKRTGL
jgi:aryl-alcohol dehydrogenase-like predicted oxidoreductase